MLALASFCSLPSPPRLSQSSNSASNCSSSTSELGSDGVGAGSGARPAAPAPEPFVFVGVYGAGAGGRTTVDRFLRISGTGYAQGCSVRDDTVIRMEEVQVAIDNLIKQVESSFPQLPRAFTHRGDGLSSPDAFIPSYVRIAIRLASGQIYDWAGYETELSPTQQDLMQRVQENVQQGRVLTTETSPAYIAAYWLSDRVSSRFQREGLLQTIAPEASLASPALHESLRHPFRLIPVDRGENPFQIYQRSFMPGRSVIDALYWGTAYQVRSYTVAVHK